MKVHKISGRSISGLMVAIAVNLLGAILPRLSAQSADTVKASTVEKIQKSLKVSGYVQFEWQYGQRDAKLDVGSPNAEDDRNFNRFGIRRGRLKLQYQKSIADAVLQMDFTEKGIELKDAYLSLRIPNESWIALTAGVFNRPFGREIEYSSSRRESPERSMVFRTLFPQERDVGMMLTLQPETASPWHFLKFQGGLFGGNGIKTDPDSRKDFIGHLSFDRQFKKGLTLSAGISGYFGKAYQGTDSIYRMSGPSFVLNDNATNLGKFANRRYYGFDIGSRFETALGSTKLVGELIFGQQPGAKSNSKSPNSAELPSNDTYIRSFNGGYVSWAQGIGKTRFSSILKYDWYQPNIDVRGNQIGQNGTTAGDVPYHTLGIGGLYDADPIRVTLYYDFVKNGTSTNLSGFGTVLPANKLTLRLQFKF